MNNDGILDLVGTRLGGLDVYLGNGDGSFQQTRNTRLINYNSAGGNTLALGDVTSDGKLDVLSVSAGNVVLYRGAGTGGFQAPITVASGPFSSPSSFLPPSVQVRDFNGDGKLDFLLGGNGRILLFVNKGGGNFAPPFSTAVTGSAAVGDFNGDG
jgi:hypothetical protein